MADPEHLLWLDEGAEAWNRRRQEVAFVADLSEADLSHKELSNFDFSHSMFAGSNFTQCLFRDCDFSGAIFGVAPIYFLEGKVFVSVGDGWKDFENQGRIEHIASLGYSILATRGTAEWLKAKASLDVEVVNKVYEGRPNIEDIMKDSGIVSVISFTHGAQAIEDSVSNRLLAVQEQIPLAVSVDGLKYLIGALESASQDRDTETEFDPPPNPLGSNFKSAVFIETKVDGAIFEHCDFTGADLRGAMGLTETQLSASNGSFATQLPVGISRPNEWGTAAASRVASEKLKIATSIAEQQKAVDLNVAMLQDQVQAEVDYLQANLPNDPVRLADYQRQINFLRHLGTMLGNLASTIQDEDEAAGLMIEIRDEVELWFSQNRAELVDTAIRVPAMAGSIGLLGLAGASMGPATIAAVALIGGPKVVSWYKKMKSEK